jgi:hypothetical protein
MVASLLDVAVAVVRPAVLLVSVGLMLGAEMEHQQTLHAVAFFAE